MTGFNEAVLILHFLGLGLGLSVSIGNIAMMGVMAKAAPPEKAVLGRFMPAISRFGRAGLGLLWLTGLTMVFTRWNGFASMPWTFFVKLTAVVALTLTVTYITVLEGRIARGDAAAAASIQTFGKIASLCALVVVIFAVITFN